MNRRKFMQTFAASAAALGAPNIPAEATHTKSVLHTNATEEISASSLSLEGHTLLCSFAHNGETWKVYEDLTRQDGDITFLSSRNTARVLPKYLEAVFQPAGSIHLGLDIKDIGMSGADLLADQLLRQGDPAEDEVRRAAPPMHSGLPVDLGYKATWDNLVSTSECADTTAVYSGGQTRTYHPSQYFPELTADKVGKRHEGLVGGWMPAVHKVLPESDTSYYDIILFADVTAKDRYIVQTWHRTAHIVNGTIRKVVYGYSYPAYGRRRQDPTPEEFYLGMFLFAEYWQQKLSDMSPVQLPDTSWSNISRYAFVKEQMVRPGGVYPKYGAIDRDYLSPEYDGFQDTFTMSFYANMEWGRLDLASKIFDNYFTEFVNDNGMINMRGAETGQFGLTLALIARYYRYTQDRTLLLKHRKKIEATAVLLEEFHDESLALDKSNPGYGLIHGWCESDSCLGADPSIWWKPYFSNSAFTVRGWREIAQTWSSLQLPNTNSNMQRWLNRANQLQARLAASIDDNTDRTAKPPYIGPLPDTHVHFREALLVEESKRSEQDWAHRCYAELLQPDVLSKEQANRVIDCMRAYGCTTLGVVANVEKPNPKSRSLLGFISYGYAQMLLRLDRIEEYILFLYSHRYHCHSRGSWTAAEVSGVTGGDALFCLPAQMTVPLLLRWMLVFDDADENALHFAKAVPRAWITPGKPISIQSAHTLWGPVNFSMQMHSKNEVVATVDLLSAGQLPNQLHVRFRLPDGQAITSATVNGKDAALSSDRETVSFSPGGEYRFEIRART